jgi:predicted heme/steroid binding protein
MKSQYDLRAMICQFQKEICYYSQMQIFSTCPYVKAHFERLIKVRTEEFINVLSAASNESNENSGTFERQKEFTLEELATYNGASGRAAYVAVNGIVYDLSKEATWGGGTHFGLYAGKNLSTEFMGCHKGMVEILNKLPKVGLLR